VVDDDASIRLMVREVLGSAGFVIEEAEGGRQALRLFESFRPDVVLLDILMPEMDGFATLRSLRAGDAGAACPVVMITGLQDPGALEQAYEIGATDFVTKPINWALLRHRLNYVLRTSTRRPTRDRSSLEDALRLAGVGTWCWDSETDRLHVSDRFLEMLSLTRRGPLASRYALARVHPDDRSRVLRALRQSVSGNGEDNLEMSFRLRPSGGGDRYLRIRAEAARGNGGPVNLSGILEDVSEEKLMEQKLHDLQSSAGKIQRMIRGLLEPETEDGEPTDPL
jgi:PAS domain S-box-containing protein